MVPAGSASKNPRPHGLLMAAFYDSMSRMARRCPTIIFIAVLAGAILVGYRDFLRPNQSLALAFFYDPSPQTCYYPWLVESTRQLREGHFPLWCSNEGAGMPLLANFQTAPFHPFNLVFSILPLLKLLDYVLLFRLFLLGLFTYLLAVQLGLEPLAAAFAALGLCFGGYVERNINLCLLNNEIWIPAGLLLAEKLIKGRTTLFRCALLAAVTALDLTAGNPQSSLSFAVLVAAYALVRGGWHRKRGIVAVLLGLGFGVLLSWFQLLGFAEYLTYAWSYRGSNANVLDQISVRWLFTFFAPWFFCDAQGGREMQLLPGYTGMIPVLLALLSLARLRTLPRSAQVFWIGLPVFFGLIFNLPPLSALPLLPGLSQLRIARTAAFGFFLCLSLLSGFGLQLLLRKQIILREWWGALALAFAGAMLSLLMAFLFPLACAQSGWHFWDGMIPVLFFCASGAAGLLGIKLERRSAAAIALNILALVNLFYLAVGLHPVTDLNLEDYRFHEQISLAPSLRGAADPVPTRFVGMGEAQLPNYNLLLGLDDLRVQEGSWPKGYAEAMADLDGVTLARLGDKYIHSKWRFQLDQSSLANPFMDRWGVKYIISNEPLQISGYELVREVSDQFLYQNHGAWPRAWTVSEDGRSDFSGAQFLAYAPDRVEVMVNRGAPVGLVLTDQYAPGWRAFSEPQGTELRIQKEDLLFRKVMLGPEDRWVRFIYQPWAFRLGLYTSLASWAGWFFLTAIGMLLIWPNSPVARPTK
jgi:hypothetical protein